MQVLKRIFSPIICGLLLACNGKTTPPDIEAGGVVSTSLCADAYVLDIIAHSDIKALSWQAADKLSLAPLGLRNRPKARDDFETLLTLKPDLVVFGAGEGQRTKKLLDKAGIKYISLDWAEDFSGIEKNLRKLAKAANIDYVLKAGFADKTAIMPKTKKAEVLYLSSAGSTAGPGTFIDVVIRSAGGENIISQKGWHRPDPEILAGLKPDLIITSFFADGYKSVSAAGVKNKIIKDKIKNTKHINIAGKYWPCAAPPLLEARNILAEKIRELE